MTRAPGVAVHDTGHDTSYDTDVRPTEAARTRMLNEVDEQRNPRTNATLDQLLDRYLATLDVAVSTKRMYTRYLEQHVRPFVGQRKAGAVGAEALDSLYAELRRCRVHCTSRRGIDRRDLPSYLFHRRPSPGRPPLVIWTWPPVAYKNRRSVPRLSVLP